jgi:hypothetical protein
VKIQLNIAIEAIPLRDSLTHPGELEEVQGQVYCPLLRERPPTMIQARVTVPPFELVVYHDVFLLRYGRAIVAMPTPEQFERAVAEAITKAMRTSKRTPP